MEITINRATLANVLLLMWMGYMTKEQLLGEIEDLLRNTPPRATIRHETDENLSWLGRVAAAIEAWDTTKTTLLERHLRQFHGDDARAAGQAYRNIRTLLFQAQHDLRMETVGPLNTAVERGMIFAYFDEVRKIIELASNDLFFVDPYLDAEFVSKYLPFASPSVTVRLLTKHKLPKLLPAVDAFTKQHQLSIQIRSTDGLHDRYVFVDRQLCYQSGASFKDGARVAATTLTQITDAFSAVLKTYEDLWHAAKVER